MTLPRKFDPLPALFFPRLVDPPYLIGEYLNIRKVALLTCHPLLKGPAGILLKRHLNLHKSFPQIPVPNAEGLQSVPLFN